MSIVEVRDLRLELNGTDHDIVSDISFTIESGEILALVGESGSGKTTIGRAILGDARTGARITRGEIIVAGLDVLHLGRDELRAMRGSLVSYVSQDPTQALNPAATIGGQLNELLVAHQADWDAQRRRRRVQEVMAEVKLPDGRAFLRRYPHQLSGGQAQRVVLALAWLLRPKLVVLDEPTTGLDVVTQAHVLDTIGMLCRAHDIAGLFITHDLGVVAHLADRVMVTYAGRVVELGTTHAVFGETSHPYTRHLIDSTPAIGERRRIELLEGSAPRPGSRPAGCFFAPRCRIAEPACSLETPALTLIEPQHLVHCRRIGEVKAGPASAVRIEAASDLNSQRTTGDPILAVKDLWAFYGANMAVSGVSLDLGAGECLALVGESGSGKTTLARAIVGLHPERTGKITYNGVLLGQHARGRPAAARQEIQYIFQSPYASLNPRRTVAQALMVPVRHLLEIRRSEARVLIRDALDAVALSDEMANRYPHELSGGERQRVAIARALICKPKILLCDEVTSSLDVSVQATIVALLQDLQQTFDLSIVFVTHNLPLVRSIADRVAVMQDGKVVEESYCEDVFEAPRAEYTKLLLEKAPALDGSFAAQSQEVDNR